MPVVKAKSKMTMKTFCATLTVMALLSILSFISGGDYRNFFVFVGLVVVVIIVAVKSLQGALLRKSCNVYTRASVSGVEHVGSATYLVLHYSVLGQNTVGTVKYLEKRVPAIGTDVGIYYDEDHSSLCMLRIYKEHRPGWTSLTKRSYDQGVLAVSLFGLFFVALGVTLLVLMFVRTAEYTETAYGTVVDYDARFESHTPDTPGTYEYTPIVSFEADGREYLARSIQIQVAKTYDIGQEVTVHYSIANPNVVIIAGDNTTAIGALLITAIGSVFLGLGIRMLIKRKLVLYEIKACEKRINFM